MQDYTSTFSFYDVCVKAFPQFFSFILKWQKLTQIRHKKKPHATPSKYTDFYFNTHEDFTTSYSTISRIQTCFLILCHSFHFMKYCLYLTFNYCISVEWSFICFIAAVLKIPFHLKGIRWTTADNSYLHQQIEIKYSYINRPAK